MKRRLALYCLIITMGSCSGYTFRRQTNPLASFGITSVSIPMFLNRTPLANLSTPFTKETYKLLNEYRDLKVYTGNYVKADAVLLGTIKANPRLRQVVKTTGTQFSDTTTENLSDSTDTGSNGSRGPFNIPQSSSVNLVLNLILIKNPSNFDLKLAQSSLGKFFIRNPKVIFNETIGLNKTFSRKIFGTTDLDEGGVANYTINRGIQERAINQMVITAMQSFKGLVLDAF